jgi:hypothetical protein
MEDLLSRVFTYAHGKSFWLSQWAHKVRSLNS